MKPSAMLIREVPTIAYQLRSGPVQWDVAQHIANYVHKSDPFIREDVRLGDDQFASPFVKVMRNLVSLIR